MAATATRTGRLSAVLRQEDRLTPLELFFDLVFVLAITQCTALMADSPTWAIHLAEARDRVRHQLAREAVADS